MLKQVKAHIDIKKYKKVRSLCFLPTQFTNVQARNQWFSKGASDLKFHANKKCLRYDQTDFFYSQSISASLFWQQNSSRSLFVQPNRKANRKKSVMNLIHARLWNQRVSMDFVHILGWLTYFRNFTMIMRSVEAEIICSVHNNKLQTGVMIFTRLTWIWLTVLKSL